jgi:hypothetical protein
MTPIGFSCRGGGGGGGALDDAFSCCAQWHATWVMESLVDSTVPQAFAILILLQVPQKSKAHIVNKGWIES